MGLGIRWIRWSRCKFVKEVEENWNGWRRVGQGMQLYHLETLLSTAEKTKAKKKQPPTSIQPPILQIRAQGSGRIRREDRKPTHQDS